ncbi:SWAP/Surp [Dillenia turbinata]|uniref:SWAP/Surp n=1 Tax=Dillenia turbinata TaxID=194707 RepID=A0AAN8V6Y5_9MAGN
MEKGAPSSLFVNDGSFMEKFKQLQQEKEKPVREPKHSTPSPVTSKTGLEVRANNRPKIATSSPGGKLAFSLKQKSKIAAPPIKLGADEEDDEKDSGDNLGDGPAKRQKLGQSDTSEPSSRQVDVAPPSPSDPAVKKVADKLASFVAKNGKQFEDVTRQRNPGDTPFKFLFDESCADYKYYEYKLIEEQKALGQTRESQASHSGNRSASTSKVSIGSQRSHQQSSGFQIPASALYDSIEDAGATSGTGESSAPTGSDPISMMEFYMKKAAQEERRRQPKQSKDEMPPPASLQGGPVKRGHHMGDYIPPEELEKFLAGCNDVTAQKAAREAAERARIQADNVGHKLLSKMGWREGEGLGSSRSGMSDPIMAGNVKIDNLGVGAQKPGEVTPDDDIYEQYKKRMMLGYRYRPNPLNNPRKAYY